MLLSFCVVALLASATTAVPLESMQQDLQERKLPKDVEVYLPPVLSNLASHGTAKQSSTYESSGSCGAPSASKAIDGNTEGIFSWCSVTRTNKEAGAWWEVDLKQTARVLDVYVFNRVDDCCMDWLSDFEMHQFDNDHKLVYYSNYPLSTGGKEIFHFPNYRWAYIYVRFVRIQLVGTNYLTLAEVQVFGLDTLSKVRNLARKQTATQSSTYSHSCNPEAGKAVDGNSEGVFHPWCSVSHTNNQQNAWWEVELESSSSVQVIRVFNRVDCCMDRLTNFNVTYFGSSRSVLKTDTNSESAQEIYEFASTPAVENVRYVRVTLNNRNFLNIAEVEVFGTDARSYHEAERNAHTNLARNQPAKQSSVDSGAYACNPTAEKAVDGNTYGIYPDCSVTCTKNENSSWWEVDLGRMAKVSSIFLFNRQDSCMERLSNFDVILFDDRRLAVKTFHEEAGGEKIHGYLLDSPEEARYVRVQLLHDGILSLAEVEVYG
eukprot:m.306429 g.306429  ORF g.306429 m.306429 type:complete len:489 (+) comp41228_c0_seq1:1017-2483(+)